MYSCISVVYGDSSISICGGATGREPGRKYVLRMPGCYDIERNPGIENDRRGRHREHPKGLYRKSPGEALRVMRNFRLHMRAPNFTLQNQNSGMGRSWFEQKLQSLSFILYLCAHLFCLTNVPE
jgi:hypothetical protein